MTPNQQAMVYWILERENIRIKKDAGQPKPWSDNEVFQSVYFCNVDREQDRVTKWIRQNWRHEVAPQCYDFAMIVARIFNLPSTLERLMQPVETFHWIEHLEEMFWEMEDEGVQIWNGAYIISTNGKKMKKADYCINMLTKAAENPFPTDGCKTLAEAHVELMKIDGFASFLAAQVVADLKNSPGHHLYNAEDWWTFAAPGPGSLRGLSWFYGEKVTAKNFDFLMDAAMEMLSWELPTTITDVLCMQNLQNCFCEYDKFMRVTNGTGRSKRKYNGA